MDTNTAYAQPAPPPTPPTPPGYPPAAGAPAPKKKRTGCIIAAVIAAMLLCGCVGTVIIGALMLAPAEQPVTYSEADFDSAFAKMGVTWPELAEGEDPEAYERVYSGQKPADATFTEAELSAMMSYRHSPSYWPIKSMSVELTGENTGNATAVITYAGRDWPVTASGSGAASGGGLAFTVDSANVAGFEVPAQYLPMGSDFLENVINPRLARAGVSIDTIETTEEGLHFVGTMWESAEYVPKP